MLSSAEQLASEMVIDIEYSVPKIRRQFRLLSPGRSGSGKVEPGSQQHGAGTGQPWKGRVDRMQRASLLAAMLSCAQAPAQKKGRAVRTNGLLRPLEAEAAENVADQQPAS